MNQVILRLSFSLFLILGFIGSSYFFTAYLSELKASERSEWIAKKAWDITNKMSDEELVGQVIHIAIPGKVVEAIALEEIRKTKPGGIILFGKNLGKKEEIKSLTQNLQKVAKEESIQPFLISTDQEGGRVFRVQDGVTEYPGAMALGQTGKSEWGRTVGFVTSYELNALGINFLLAPILDVNNNPFNPVINTRSFGSDVSRVSTVACAYEQGAREGGALPVIKHFPGHGDTMVDSHLGLPVINKTLEDLEKLELIPFKKAIESGAEAVMTAHIVYPLIDDKYPATLSKKILTDVLRKKLKFDGIIITDAMEMHAISKNYAQEKPGVLAIQAGANIVLLTSWGETARKFKEQLSKAYEAGEFVETLTDGKKIDRLKESVYLQIKKKIEMGLYLPPEIQSNEEAEFQAYFEEKERIRNEMYAGFNANQNYLKEITKDSIRAYPRPYLPSNQGKISFVKNPHLKKVFENEKITIGNPKEMKKVLGKKESQIIILDSSSEAELKSISALAKANPQKTFVILHGGNPFIPLPDEVNLRIIFSFSLTSHSWKALGESIIENKEIPAVDLILLPKNSKAPTKTAFPYRS